MFAYLKGTLVHISPLEVTVDINGVGYQILIPLNAVDHLPGLGETVQLYTSFVVREFSHTLFGFLDPNERETFEMLLNVTGIGPKLALSLIGYLSLSALQTAILSQDILTLCKIPGVGKKTAERLIVELKDKMSHLVPSSFLDSALTSHKDPKRQQIQDAMLALVNLGYNQSKAQKAIQAGLKEVSDTCDLAALITCALRHM